MGVEEISIEMLYTLDRPTGEYDASIRPNILSVMQYKMRPAILRELQASKTVDEVKGWPYYSLNLDTIYMWPKNWWTPKAAWEFGLLHEAVHSSGHPKRMDRPFFNLDLMLFLTEKGKEDEERLANSAAILLMHRLGRDMSALAAFEKRVRTAGIHPDAEKVIAYMLGEMK